MISHDNMPYNITIFFIRENLTDGTGELRIRGLIRNYWERILKWPHMSTTWYKFVIYWYGSMVWIISLEMHGSWVWIGALHVEPRLSFLSHNIPSIVGFISRVFWQLKIFPIDSWVLFLTHLKQTQVTWWILDNCQKSNWYGMVLSRQLPFTVASCMFLFFWLVSPFYIILQLIAKK
jgi:hypothetical protein